MGDYRDDTFTGCAYHGNLDGIKKLLRTPNGHSDIEATEGGIGFQCRAMTALGIAAKNNYPDIMRLLLDNGANPNGTGSFEDYFTATPLFAAVQSQNVPAITMLMNCGADVNSSASAHNDTGGGATAMYYAANHDLLDIAMMLEDSYGACLCIPTGSGDTPMEVAIKNGHWKFASWINETSRHFVPDQVGKGISFHTVCERVEKDPRRVGKGKRLEKVQEVQESVRFF
jgi:hypothetical protein